MRGWYLLCILVCKAGSAESQTVFWGWGVAKSLNLLTLLIKTLDLFIDFVTLHTWVQALALRGFY